MAASTGSEVTQALNRFVTVLVAPWSDELPTGSPWWFNGDFMVILWWFNGDLMVIYDVFRCFEYDFHGESQPFVSGIEWDLTPDAEAKGMTIQK